MKRAAFLAGVLTGVAMVSPAFVIGHARAEPRRNISIKTEPALQPSTAPRTILISIKRQRLRLLDGEREVASSRISSGQPGFDTPTGVFSILEKHVYHESNIYEGAPMPHMQRITWSGIAMHAGVVPGYRASHGCIRLPASFAKAFFDKTTVGGRVIVTQDEVSPARFTHPALFRPLPENDPTPTHAANTQEPRVAANDATVADRAALTTLVADTQAKAQDNTPQNAAAPAKPRSRTEATRMLTARLENLAAGLKAAEDRKFAAGEKAKAALRAAQDAEAKLISVRQPFEGVLRAAASAEAARASAAQAYRAYLIHGTLAPSTNVTKTKGKQKEPSQIQPQMPPEEREQDLEDRLLDMTVEADAARAGAAAAELIIAGAKATFTTADAAKTQAIDEVRTAVTELRTAQTALIDAKAEANRRNRQLSIFISLKSQRIYIRQGFEPVLDAAIEVDDPPGAIGTHVLTAMDFAPDGNQFIWNIVSAQQPRPVAGDANPGANKKTKREPAAVSPNSPLNIEAARVALDSIRVPQDITDMIAELARPGTSLIISEKDLSRETGKGTEFVVLTR
ncbi:MAG: L,D-transpeptidase family protein [Hyphomicrobium sp.]